MRVRPEPSVLWREGMLLSTQSMQAFARELASRAAAGDALARPASFGLAKLSIDAAALERDSFAITEAEVLFPGGTLAVIPGTATVEARGFADYFKAAELDVWLGVPIERANVPQVATTAGDGGFARYAAQARETYDENLLDAVAEVEFRVLHARLFFGEEDRSGFECVQIARLAREGRPVAHSVLAPRYIPPLVACGASAALSGRLRALAQRARAEVRDLAAKVPSTSILSRVEKGADLIGFLKLSAVDRCAAVLEQIAGVPALDPFAAYVELARACGDLAPFSDERAVATLPPYRQEELDPCFQAVLAELERLLASDVPIPYDAVAFRATDDEGYFECEIPREWVAGRAVVHLAVEIERSADDVAELVSSGVVKLIAPSEYERIQRAIVSGIGLVHARVPPLAYPKRGNLHYFAVETEGASRDSWLEATRAGKVGVLSALGALGDVHYHLYAELAR